MKQPPSLIRRHAAALWYVLTVLLPVMVRTGRRPVLFHRYTGMGDILCTLPATRELQARHPGATFIYNCHRDFAAVPRLAGVASHITSLEAIGVVGHWYRFLLAGYYPFAHLDDIPGKVAQEPMVMEFCKQFGVTPTAEHPTLAIPEAARRRVTHLLAEKKLDANQLILIHPGPSWTVKEWPRERWTQLVEQLRLNGFTSIAQLGVGRYMNFGQVAVDPIPGAVSLLDQLTIEECFAIIAMARLFVGIDSGLLHIAACTRTPSVGLWGCTDPKNFYAPASREHFVVSQIECAGCYHRLPRLHWVTGCPHDIRCMREMPVEPVLAACRKTLAAGHDPN